MTHLFDLAAALGTRNEDLIGQRMRAAVDAGDGVLAGELVLMAVFVTGFPAGLAAGRAWAAARRAPAPPEPDARPDYRIRGEEGYRGVYGSQAEALRNALAETHPALPDLVTEVGYGWMMARPALPPDVRECCMVSMLIPTGFRSPLYSHLRGALRLGAPTSLVEEAIEAGIRAGSVRVEGRPEDAEDVWRTWDQVKSRAARAPEET